MRVVPCQASPSPPAMCDKEVQVWIVNGFANAEGGGGNAAGVVLPPDSLLLSPQEKQRVAAAVGLSETVFMAPMDLVSGVNAGNKRGVLPPAPTPTKWSLPSSERTQCAVMPSGGGETSTDTATDTGATRVGSKTTPTESLVSAGLQLEYFTPVQQVDVCGHATVAAMGFWWSLRNSAKLHPSIPREPLVPPTLETAATVPIHTLAGRLQVQFRPDEESSKVEEGGHGSSSVLVFMSQQVLSVDKKDAVDVAAVSSALGLAPDCVRLDVHVPVVASTGLRDIFVGVTSGSLVAMRPNMAAIAALSERHDTIGMHVWEECSHGTPPVFGASPSPTGRTWTLDVRNFAPRVGIDEECATGTANCALASLLVHATQHDNKLPKPTQATTTGVWSCG